MAGEVLGAAGHADALQALHERGDMPGHELGVRAEGTNADDRVRRIDDHVRDGREIEVQAHCGELAADRGCDAPGQLHVVHGAEREVPREGAACRGLEPGDVASLLVDGDQEVGLLGTERGGERGDLLGVAHVAGEEHDAADPLGELAPQPVRRLEPKEAREDAGGRGGREPARAHPRTAPAVSPNAILRWTMTKKITTGSAVSVAPAISGPQAVPRLVEKFASQSVSVCFSGLCSRT